MTDYVLIEGDLDEILEYNIEQAEYREVGFHDSVAFIKEDHPYDNCYLCDLTDERVPSYFRMLAEDRQGVMAYMSEPIHVDGKQI